MGLYQSNMENFVNMSDTLSHSNTIKFLEINIAGNYSSYDLKYV